MKMDDYIKRSDAIKAFDTMGRVPHEIIVDILNHVPAANVAEVVMCTECKYLTTWPDGTMECSNSHVWHGIEKLFCRFGEKEGDKQCD